MIALKHRKDDIRKGNLESRDPRPRLPDLVGEDQCMRDLRSRIASIGSHDCTVLINGESGTGKELVARHIHAASARADAPFVIADCTALPDTLFESQLFGHVKGAFTGADHSTLGLFRAAKGGTLFIDEIGELELHMQAKLLRCIQERSVLPVGAVERVQADVRIFAATHRDLKAMVARGAFREDLYYRLDVVRVDVPPLRVRRGDILRLAEHFLEEVADQYGVAEKAFSSEATSALESYDWPGNVRELRNVIDSAMVLSAGQELTPVDLPEAMRRAVRERPLEPSGASVSEEMPIRPLHVVERCLIEQALRATNGNKSRAAQLLGIERHRLSRMIHRHGLADYLNSVRWPASIAV